MCDSGFASLPKVLIQRILLYLNAFDLVDSALYVSKLWNIIGIQHLWNTLGVELQNSTLNYSFWIGELNVQESIQFIKRYRSMLKYVEDLFISGELYKHSFLME